MQLLVLGSGSAVCRVSWRPLPDNSAWTRLNELNRTVKEGETRTPLFQRLTPFVCFSVIVAIGVTWRQLAVNQEEEQAKRTTLQAAESIQNYFEARLRQNARALRRMSFRIRDGGEANKKNWTADAANYVHDVNEYRAVEWVDNDLRVQWIEPLKGNSNLLEAELNSSAQKGSAVFRARTSGHLSVSKAFLLPDGRKGFAIYSPTMGNHGLIGIVAGVCDLGRLMSSLPEELRTDFETSISDGSSLFNDSSTESLGQDTTTATAKAATFGTVWIIRTTPTAHTLAAWHSSVPDLILVFALVFAGLTCFSLIQWNRIQLHLVLESARTAALQTNHDILEAVVQSAPVGMALVGLDGRWLRVNRSLCSYLGYSEEEFLEKDFQSITHPDDLGADLELIDTMVGGLQQICQIEKRFLRSDGGVVQAIVNGSLLRNSNNSPMYFLCQIQDVTERSQREQRLNDLANVDSLTGVANRRRLDDQLHLAVESAHESQLPLSIILIDIDHFKSLNDGFGHAVGDEVLKDIAQILVQGVRSADLVARYGGEEFLILCNHTRLQDAAQLAERLRAAVEKHPWRHREITASFGVADLSNHAMLDSDLLIAADGELYRSKQAGRNRVSWATVEDSEQNAA